MEQSKGKSKSVSNNPRNTSKGDMAKALVSAVDNKWHDRDTPPPNDYDYKIIIMFNDGYISPSDGGTFHDDKSISLWKTT